MQPLPFGENGDGRGKGKSASLARASDHGSGRYAVPATANDHHTGVLIFLLGMRGGRASRLPMYKINKNLTNYILYCIIYIMNNNKNIKTKDKFNNYTACASAFILMSCLFGPALPDIIDKIQNEYSVKTSNTVKHEKADMPEFGVCGDACKPTPPHVHQKTASNEIAPKVIAKSPAVR